MNRKIYYFLSFFYLWTYSQFVQIPGCEENQNWVDPNTNEQYNIKKLQNNNMDYVLDVSQAKIPSRITLNICRSVITQECEYEFGSDVAACQEWPVPYYYYKNSLGKATQTVFSSASKSGAFQVSFKGERSVLNIAFSCKNDIGIGAPKFVSEQPDNILISWESQYACPINTGSGNKGLSAGSILLIILLVLVVVYLVLGILWQKYRNHATGSDLIPNKEFWTELPILVKDGCVFTYFKVKEKISHSSGTSSEYSKL
jgi:hypothetical protein